MNVLRVAMVILCATTACDGQEVEVQQRKVATDPVVDISGTGVDGALIFEYATGAVRLSNGAIVIADGLGATVRFFDSLGHPLQQVGRHGEGPGEFANIAWLGQCGADSVFAWDRGQHRITVIDRRGEVVRTYRVPADVAAWRIATVSCSRNGRFAFLAFPRGMRPPRGDGQSPHYKAPLYIADADGRVIHNLGEIPAAESRPLGKATSIALSDNRMYVGTKDSSFVDMYDFEGQYLGALPLSVQSRTPSRQHYERAIDAQVIWYALNETREQMREVLLEIPMPEVAPPYGGLFTDPNGLLWVETSLPGDPQTVLRAIEPNGRIVADYQLPPNLRVFEVGREHILGAYEDETGEQHVVMYTMR